MVFKKELVPGAVTLIFDIEGFDSEEREAKNGDDMEGKVSFIFYSSTSVDRGKEAIFVCSNLGQLFYRKHW